MDIPKFPPIGMPPSIWGPIFWQTMHIVTLGYSETPSKEEQVAAIQFFEGLRQMIPCPICKEHYAQHLDISPVSAVVGSRTALIYWMFILHNKVNVQLGKPEFTWSQFIDRTRKLSNLSSIQFEQPSYMPLALALLIGIGIGIGGHILYKK